MSLRSASACKITAHIAGGTFSLEKGFLRYLRETGRTDVRYLMQLGILDPQWILIHGIHVHRARHRADGARRRQPRLHADQRSRSAAAASAPIANAQRAGVNVALGTDGPMVDYSVDMVEQMKVCTLMQHVRHLDPTRMPAERAIEMATINAAKALGLEHEIGSLEAGQARRYRHVRSRQALCGRAAPADLDLRLRRQRQRCARGVGRRRDRLSRREVRAAWPMSPG